MNELVRRKKTFVSALRSPEGKAMLQILQDDFQRASQFDSDPLKMAYKTGQSDLVQYLIDMGKTKDE